ncbi:MAG TPA: MlaD family protein, partial [Baekduia sp.]|nr:MlaD family protein [Baekduia sp.]
MTRARGTLPLLLTLGACAAIAVVLLGAGGEERGHRFSVVVGEASNVVAGQALRQSGSKVGRVVSVEPAARGRDARLELEVDDAAWPLPGGTTLQLRWGGTANFGNRYIAVRPGRGPGAAVRDGGVLPTSAFETPVEFDELLSRFPAAARRDLQRLLAQGAPAMRSARAGLRRTLDRGPAALREAHHVVADINADQRAVRTLVRSADAVLGAVDEAQPDLRRLLAGAGGTFDALADEAGGLQAALAAAPGALRRTRTTLAAADEVLRRARTVTARLAP